MSRGMTVLGIIMISFYILSNLSFAVWTLWATLEQIDTGWGYGTNMEMIALMPYFHTIILLLLLSVGEVFFIISIFKRASRGVIIANVALWSLILTQIFITWLFIVY